MQLPSRRPLGFLICALPVFWFASSGRADAQVDESLVTRRWKTENFWAETFDKPIVTAPSRLDDTDESIQLFHWNSEGRIKFRRKDLDPPVWIGYRAFTLSVDTDDDRFDHAFSDVAVAVALHLGSIGDWSVFASVGGGTANDGRWDNLHALYPAATLDFTRILPPTTVWHLGLTLDGNRGLLPAYPLPYVMMEAALDPALNVLLGFPKSEISIRPFDPVTVTLRWAFAATAQARVEADLGSGFSVFAEALRRIDGFHLRHRDRTRLFYEMNTAEAGVRWKSSWMDISISAGYAFGQRFFTGPDLGNRARGTSVDDMAFIAITLPSTFWAITF